MSDDVKKDMTEEELITEVDKLEEKELEEAKESGSRVTTIAEEEKKTGQPLKITPDQMRQVAVMNHTQGLDIIQRNALKLSKKNLIRLLIATLQLPHRDNKMPSKLRDPLVKQLFIISQQVLSAKFALLQEYIISQAKLERAEKEAEKTAGKADDAKPEENKDDKLETEKENENVGTKE